MTQMILELTDGADFELTIPTPFEIDIDLGRGPQGPPGPGLTTIGDIADLETDDKSNLVAAINELNMAGVSLSILYDNAKAG